MRTQGRLYKVGDRVAARYSGFGLSHYPGTVVRIHFQSDQYDVRFDAFGKTVTLFASEIRELPSTDTITVPSTAISTQYYVPHNHHNDSVKPSMTNQEYRKLITSHRHSRNVPDPNTSGSWNLNTFKRFERDHPSLCDRVLNADPKQTSNQIISRIRTAASQQNSDDVHYVHALKYVRPNIDDDEEKTDDVFKKYGSRHTISMHLDFDRLVTGNDKFEGEMNGELATILSVTDPH